MKNIFIYIALIIFNIVGLIMLLFGISGISEYKYKSKIYIETPATIIEHQTGNSSVDVYVDTILNDKIVFRYYVNNVEYESSIKLVFNKYNIYKGMNTKIKYNPANPEDIIWAKDHSNVYLVLYGFISISLVYIKIYRDIKQKKEQNYN